MSLLDRWRTTANILTADTMVSIPPWDGHTDQVATLPQEVAQAFGINTTTDSVTFDQAMSIPAVKAGFLSIAGKMGSVPLVGVRERAGNDPERVTRPFLVQPDPQCTRAATITDTVGDLIFYGLAYWYVSARDFAGFPVAASRVHPSAVSIDTSAQVVRITDPWLGLNGDPVDYRDVVAFRGPDLGLLYHGGRTLKTALMLEDAVRRYSALDVPLGLITDDTGAMLADEVQVFLDSWETARKARTTGYLPVGLKYQNPGFNAQQVELSDARGFCAAEIARMLNLPASIVNAPTGSSLTYATTVDNARTLVDITYAPYRAAIEGRLSMGDVTPAGTTVFFDFADFLRGDLNQVITTGVAAVAGGLMTADEVRQQWLHLGPIGGTSGVQNQNSAS